MKKYFVTIIVAAILASCNGKDNGLLDPAASLYLNGREVLGTKGESDPLCKTDTQELPSVKDVIKQGALIQAYAMFGPLDSGEVSLGIDDLWRDTINDRFDLPSYHVIRWDGTLETYDVNGDIGIIDFKDAFIINWEVDTIAYFPEKTIRSVQAAVTEAYNNENYEECYRLFRDGIIFTPTTGAIFKNLVENGLN